MSGYPRFANYVRKTAGPESYQWTETGSVLLCTESERQFLLAQGYAFPEWENDGKRSAVILTMNRLAS